MEGYNFKINWEKLIHSKTLDNLSFKEIKDTTAVPGTRPELLVYKNKNYVATANYGPKNNEVRLYGILFSKVKNTLGAKSSFYRQKKLAHFDPESNRRQLL